MSKIKKIYSAKNAHELLKMQARGLVVMGYFGNTAGEVRSADEMKYPPSELQGVMGAEYEHRFIRIPAAFKFFGVVSIFEPIDVTDEEVRGVSWIPFPEFRKNLKKQFEAETGWDESRLGDDGLGADLTGHLNYESAYASWLEIQLAKPQRVADVPDVEVCDGE